MIIFGTFFIIAFAIPLNYSARTASSGSSRAAREPSDLEFSCAENPRTVDETIAQQ